MDYKDIYTIRRNYFAGEYNPPAGLYNQIGSLVSENHVFDENLSVKRNKELVAEHNENVRIRRQEYRELENRLFNEMREEVVKYLMGTYGLNRKQAEKVESYVYTEKHAWMSDYFAYIDEFGRLCKEVMSV